LSFTATQSLDTAISLAAAQAFVGPMFTTSSVSLVSQAAAVAAPASAPAPAPAPAGRHAGGGA
jgi:hypothetical protein